MPFLGDILDNIKISKQSSSKNNKNKIREQKRDAKNTNSSRAFRIDCLQRNETNRFNTVDEIEPFLQNNTKIDSKNGFNTWSKKRLTNDNLKNLLTLSQFNLNDRVNIDLDFEIVQSLQVGHGGWCEAMFEVSLF